MPIAADGPRVRRHHGGRAGDAARRRRSPRSRRPRCPDVGGQRPRAQHATTTASWSAASCTTTPSAPSRSPSLAALAPGARGPRASRSTSTRPASPPAPTFGVVSAARLGRAPARRRPGGAARHGAGCRSTSPAPTIRRRRWTSTRAGHRRSDRAAVNRGALLGVDPLLDGESAVDAAADRRSSRSSSCSCSALVATMLMVWFERKVIAGMQNRVGPNKAGPFGILQTLADGIKLFFKEDLLPDRADRFVFRLAPLPRLRARLPRVERDPARRRLPRRQRRHRDAGSATRRGCSSPTRRSASCSCSRCRRSPSTAIMLAGWSSGSKYPLLGVGAGDGADGQLRGRARAQPGVGPAVRRHAEHAPASSPSRTTIIDWNIVATGFVPFFIFVDRRHRRAQPPAVRPRRGRAGARRRVQHRVLEHPVRAVLPGRVHEHDHDERRSS